MKTKLNVRIADDRGEAFMGDGILQLLQRIEEHGSILHAAKTMKLSYVKAHQVLKRLEKKLGAKVVDRQAGGTQGGGARLTDFGARFVKAYAAYSARVRRFADGELKKMLKATTRTEKRNA